VDRLWAPYDLVSARALRVQLPTILERRPLQTFDQPRDAVAPHALAVLLCFGALIHSHRLFLAPYVVKISMEKYKLSASELRKPDGVSRCLPIFCFLACEDLTETGPPRARTQVVYVDLGYWAISGSIQYGPHTGSRTRVKCGIPQVPSRLIHLTVGP